MTNTGQLTFWLIRYVYLPLRFVLLKAPSAEWWCQRVWIWIWCLGGGHCYNQHLLWTGNSYGSVSIFLYFGFTFFVQRWSEASPWARLILSPRWVDSLVFSLASASSPSVRLPIGLLFNLEGISYKAEGPSDFQLLNIRIDNCLVFCVIGIKIWLQRFLHSLSQSQWRRWGQICPTPRVKRVHADVS